MDYLKQNKPKFKEKKIKETPHIRKRKYAKAHDPFNRNKNKHKEYKPTTLINSAHPFVEASMEQFKMAMLDFTQMRVDSYNSLLFAQLWLDGSNKARLINRRTIEEVTFKDTRNVTREELEQLNNVMGELGKDLFGNPLKNNDDEVVKILTKFNKKNKPGIRINI